MTEEQPLGGGGNGGAGRAPGQPNLMAVETHVVLDGMVERLFNDVEERDRLANLSDAAEAAIERAPVAVLGEERASRASDRAASLARRLARLGYLARLVERERFPTARDAATDLVERLRERAAEAGDGDGRLDAAVALAGELARREPGERPEPDDERAASWQVPGPGGHVRHYLALRTVQLELEGADPPRTRPTGLTRTAELKRCWMYGFFLRCCEEAAPDEAPAT